MLVIRKRQPTTSVSFAPIFRPGSTRTTNEMALAINKNRQKHHQKKTFAKEYDEFIPKYGFTIFNG